MPEHDDARAVAMRQSYASKAKKKGASEILPPEFGFHGDRKPSFAPWHERLKSAVGFLLFAAAIVAAWLFLQFLTDDARYRKTVPNTPQAENVEIRLDFGE